jgi:putrescine transport system ATP-binding protein
MYEQPNSRWVADFIGEVNLLEGRVREAGPDATVVETAVAGVVRAAPCADAVVGATVWVALRPEKIEVALAPPANANENCAVGESSAANENCVTGEVTGIGYLGDLSLYQVRLDSGATVKASLANVRRQVDQPVRPLSRVWLTWADDAGVVLTK